MSPVSNASDKCRRAPRAGGVTGGVAAERELGHAWRRRARWQHASSMAWRTYSSWAPEKGVPGKVIAQLMGHAKVDTTLNVYTQVVDGSLRGAADTVGSEWVTIVHKPEKTMLGHAEGGRRAERGQEIQSQKREGTRNKRRAFLARRTGRFPTLAGPEDRL